MKALSIRQPWAWLLAHGFKDVENRSWATRFRGVFRIHAGLVFDKAGYQWVKLNFPEIAMPEIAVFERGGFVGQATLVDCVSPGGGGRDGRFHSPWYFHQFGFVVSNASPMAFERAKGRLGLYETPSADDSERNLVAMSAAETASPSQYSKGA